MFTQKSLALALACVVVSLREHTAKHDQNTELSNVYGDLSTPVLPLWSHSVQKESLSSSFPKASYCQNNMKITGTFTNWKSNLF